MNPRIRTLRDEALNSYIDGTPAPADPEWEPFWAGLAGDPPILRDAKAFAWRCRRRPVSIRDNERIVGGRPDLRYGRAPAKPAPAGRQGFGGVWFPLADDAQAFFRQGVLSMAGNHMTMDFASVMQDGLEGRIAQARARQARIAADEPGADGKRDFLEALILCAQGHIDLCRRYGALAAELAARAAGPQRRLELEQIAETCRRVPAQPPRTFPEACQALWFAFMLVPDAPGRVDQYLYPFYRQDRELGTLTADDAREYLSCLWLKYFENPGGNCPVGAVHHLTLGGLTADGADASNEVTRLCLDVTEDLHLQRPQVGLRWSRHTPDALLQRAVAVLGSHCGSPDFSNDEQIVPALVAAGVAPEDARDFSLSGCNEVIVTGKAQMGSVEGFINLPKVLRIVLGLEPELGPGQDLGTLTDAAALQAACATELARLAEVVHRTSVGRDQHSAQYTDLACSLMVNDCIEKVKGYHQGGARYNYCNWDVVGIANLADSLAAIDKLVFQQRACTLPELAQALRVNWEGHEPLRRRILNDMPHYGNDDDAVDRIAAGIVEQLSALLKRYAPFRGGQYILGTLAGAENMHIEFGRVTGATPDGRKAGEPLADSMGAAQGRDRRGVTALLNSVAKLPHRLLPTASTLNVRIDPKLVKTPGGAVRVAALIRSHFLSGGQHMQLNLISREMLEEAQRHPEQHPELMVRVAGYSAPFVSLWEDLQDEIISRTEHPA